MKWNRFLFVLTLMFAPITAGLLAAQDANPNCSLIVPAAPLTAQGLATPYQLVATDTAQGECHETNTDQSAFVQAAILDPATGQISIYNPLVIDQNTVPAIAPVVPVLPSNAIVALWFGYNGDTLTLQSDPGVLDSANCVNGLPGSTFGQYSYCNAPAFFRAAHRAIRRGQLRVPPLGTAVDGRPCPSVRDFLAVDQDQSDNLPTTYWMTSGGMAQKTALNLLAYPDGQPLGNPSDNRLVDVALDGALGCTPWKVPDLADPGAMVPSLPTNELQARAFQRSPVALVPAGDPMVLNNGAIDLSKLNAYRRGVDQPQVRYNWQADTARYCRHMFRIAPERLLLNQDLFTKAASPDPGAADSLFTFLTQRFVASYEILGCADLIHQPDPISVTTNDQGVTTAAQINRTRYNWCRQQLSWYERRDNDADDAGRTRDDD
ncbi:MAG TPA: hypothetical protein VGF08_05185 [Terriglobales bacterium]|jgi:hypothetical protein